MDSGQIYKEALEVMQSEQHSITLLVGPPGTGKTRSAIQSAIEKDYKNISVIKPPVPFGKTYGLLPGELNEKMSPWMENINDILVDLDLFPPAVLDPKKGCMEYVSFEHCQGRTFHGSFIIIDEAQNCTIDELYVLMTRIGENSRMAICGDINQKSENQKESGLSELHTMMLKTENMNVIDFTHAKCYRSGLCGEVTKMFDKSGG